MSVFPGLGILAAVLGFNLFGDGLKDSRWTWTYERAPLISNLHLRFRVFQGVSHVLRLVASVATASAWPWSATSCGKSVMLRAVLGLLSREDERRRRTGSLSTERTLEPIQTRSSARPARRNA